MAEAIALHSGRTASGLRKVLSKGRTGRRSPVRLQVSREQAKGRKIVVSLPNGLWKHLALEIKRRKTRAPKGNNNYYYYTYTYQGNLVTLKAGWKPKVSSSLNCLCYLSTIV